MADNRKYYYLKLKENFFDSDSIVGGRMSDKCPPFVRDGKSALFSSLAARFLSASVEDCPIISSMSVI